MFSNICFYIWLIEHYLWISVQRERQRDLMGNYKCYSIHFLLKWFSNQIFTNYNPLVLWSRIPNHLYTRPRGGGEGEVLPRARGIIAVKNISWYGRHRKTMVNGWQLELSIFLRFENMCWFRGFKDFSWFSNVNILTTVPPLFDCSVASVFSIRSTEQLSWQELVRVLGSDPTSVFNWPSEKLLRRQHCNVIIATAVVDLIWPARVLNVCYARRLLVLQCLCVKSVETYRQQESDTTRCYTT